MPDWGQSSLFAQSGLYEWLSGRLEAVYGGMDPRSAFGGALVPQAIPERLARCRAGLAVTVPAWMLDGFGARAAGFSEVVPQDRAVRAAAYEVRPDDSVAPSPPDADGGSSHG